MVFSGPLTQWHPLRGPRLGVAVAAVLMWAAAAEARETVVPDAAITVSQLPPQGQLVYGAIRTGGPFRYSKDGAVFGNRERVLPGKPRGYYREYTVAAPGARDRGARRIVCGGRQPTAPEACYYTADHYSSFQRISP